MGKSKGSLEAQKARKLRNKEKRADKHKRLLYEWEGTASLLKAASEDGRLGEANAEQLDSLALMHSHRVSVALGAGRESEPYQLPDPSSWSARVVADYAIVLSNMSQDIVNERKLYGDMSIASTVNNLRAYQTKMSSWTLRNPEEHDAVANDIFILDQVNSNRLSARFANTAAEQVYTTLQGRYHSAAAQGGAEGEQWRQAMSELSEAERKFSYALNPLI